MRTALAERAPADRKVLKRLVNAARPRRWLFVRQPYAQRQEAVSELARRAAANDAAVKAFRAVWDRLLLRGEPDLLAVAARQIGRWKIASLAGDLVRCFSLSTLGDDTEGVREAAVEALASVGQDAAPYVSTALLDADPTMSAWAVLALRRIGLGQACGALAALYQRVPPESQERVARRLAGVSRQSWEDTIALLGSGLKLGEPERSLAKAVLLELERDQLERECLSMWTSRRSVSARSVLVHLLGYDAAALN